MGVGAGRKDEKLREAAEGYLKIGDFEHYCNIMAEVGEWEKALMAAPAVGHDFWSELMRRYVRSRAEMSGIDRVATSELAPSMLALGDVDMLLERMEGDGRLEDAFLVACASSAGAFGGVAKAGGAPGASGQLRANAGPRAGWEAGVGAGKDAPAQGASPLHGQSLSRLPSLGALPPLEVPRASTIDRHTLPPIGALSLGSNGSARSSNGAGGAESVRDSRSSAGSSRFAPIPERLERLRAVARRIADEKAAKGLCVVGAAHSLSVDDVDSAVDCLLRGDELEVAWALCDALGARAGLRVRRRAAILLAHACVEFGAHAEALRALAIGEANLPLEAAETDSVGGEQAWGTGPTSYRAMICAALRPPAGEEAEAAADALYAAAGIESPRRQLQASEATTGIERAARLLLSRTQSSRAAEIAVAAAQALVDVAAWDPRSDAASAIVRVLRPLRLADVTVGVRDAVLCLSIYLGAFDAALCGYTPVVGPMLTNAVNLAMAAKIDLPLVRESASPSASSPAAELRKLAAILPITEAEQLLADLEERTRLPEVLRAAAGAVRKEVANAEANDPAASAGQSSVVVPLGMGVPSRARTSKRSALSGVPVCGPAVCLADGSTLVTRAEATMWSRCNPFSMLNSGEKMYPH